MSVHDEQKPDVPPSRGESLVLLGTGTMLAAMVIVGFYLGFLLDNWLDTKPFFMLGFAALGLVGSLIKLHKLLV